jgi:hypothetical protein
VSRCTDGFCFFFNESFDIFQNGRINVGNGKEYPVFLRNDEKGINVSLGTTLYDIFPNTRFPESYPFFSFMMKGSYLFIDTGKEYPVISISYEGGVVAQEFKTKNEMRELAYCSCYKFQKDDFYSYENSDTHSSVTAVITYQL